MGCKKSKPKTLDTNPNPAKKTPPAPDRNFDDSETQELVLNSVPVLVLVPVTVQETGWITQNEDGVTIEGNFATFTVQNPNLGKPMARDLMWIDKESSDGVSFGQNYWTIKFNQLDIFTTPGIGFTNKERLRDKDTDAILLMNGHVLGFRRRPLLRDYDFGHKFKSGDSVGLLLSFVPYAKSTSSEEITTAIQVYFFLNGECLGLAIDAPFFSSGFPGGLHPLLTFCGGGGKVSIVKEEPSHVQTSRTKTPSEGIVGKWSIREDSLILNGQPAKFEFGFEPDSNPPKNPNPNGTKIQLQIEEWIANCSNTTGSDLAPTDGKKHRLQLVICSPTQSNLLAFYVCRTDKNWKEIPDIKVEFAKSSYTLYFDQNQPNSPNNQQQAKAIGFEQSAQVKTVVDGMKNLCRNPDSVTCQGDELTIFQGNSKAVFTRQNRVLRAFTGKLTPEKR